MSEEERIFTEALANGSARERSAFLDLACAGKPELCARVELLLAAYDRAGSFLESAPTGITISPDDASALHQELAERPGAMVGPYKLLEQIGEGGMGVVFMAEQLRPMHRRVAIKIIKPGLDTRQVIARFEAERQALALMDHPNIARVLDAGATETGRPYFVMELVRGLPITDYCDQQKLSPRQRLVLFVQVCQAVQHAHQKGVIHRDLKPTNVLVSIADDGKPVPKVIDFGIAKATSGRRLTDRTLFTEFHQLVGTPLYMSPEQAQTSALEDVDTRSDVYSLGVLLYELLTGTTPFDRQRLAEAAQQEVRRIIREEDPPRPSTRLSTLGDTLTTVSAQRQSDPKKLSQTIRGELDWIVMKALEKDRRRRYETATGIAHDVERYLADQPVEACPPSRIYRLRKTIRRNKAALTTGAIIAIVLVAATAISSWEAVRAHRAERQITHERDEAQAEKKRANEQAAIAKAVNKFLNEDVLGQASVYRQAHSAIDRGLPATPDPNLRVRDAVKQATARLEGRFKDEPLVEASIRETIAHVDTSFWDMDDAAKLLESAVRLRQQFASSDDPDTLDAMVSLAWADYCRGPSSHSAESEKILQKVLETRRRVMGADNEATLDSQDGLAAFFEHQNRLPEAEAMYTDLCARLARLYGRDDLRTVSAYVDLAHVYDDERKLQEAEPLLLHGFERQLSAWGPLDPTVIFTERYLGRLRAHQGRYWEGEVLAAESALCARRIFDPGSDRARGPVEILNGIYKEHAQHPDAGPMFLGGLDGFYKLEETLRSIELWLFRRSPQAYPPQRRDVVGTWGQPQERMEHLRDGLAYVLADRLQFRPEDATLASQVLAMQLYLGEEERFLETSRIARKVFGKSPGADLLRVLLVGPIDPQFPPQTPAEESPNARKPAGGYGYLFQGLYYFRAGRFARAAEKFATSDALFAKGPQTPTPIYLRIVAMAHLAMCDHSLARRAEAMAALERATQELHDRRLIMQNEAESSFPPCCLAEYSIRKATLLIEREDPPAANSQPPAAAPAPAPTSPSSQPN